MKALIYEGPQTLQYKEFDAPTLQQDSQDDTLIKIDAVSICGSDMHAYLGHDDRRPAPLILGHEAAGTIIEGPNKGARVAINPLVTCGTCKHCQSGRTNVCASRQIISMPPRQGAFGEYITMPSKNLVMVPDHVSSETATLCEPIACGFHAVKLAKRALYDDITEQHIMVIGGGAIGLGCALSLQYFGAHNITIIEPNPLRQQFITAHYNFTVIDNIQKAKGSYALIMDAYGAGISRQQASQLVEPGGVIIHTGLANDEPGFDARRATLQEITFIGTYTYTHDDYKECAEAMFTGGIDAASWTQSWRLSEGAKAFDSLRKGIIGHPKITLIP